MCVLDNAFGKNGFLANERIPYSGSETSVRNIIHSVQRSDDKMLEFILGDEQF